MRFWVLAISILLGALTVHAATNDEIYLLLKDTNEKVAAQSTEVGNAKQKIQLFEDKLNGMQSTVSAYSQNSSFFIVSAMAFTAFLSTFFNYIWVIRPLRKQVKLVLEQAGQPPAPIQLFPQQRLEEPFDLVKRKFCPKDGAEKGDFEAYCADHGKKLIEKEVKVPREIYPPVLPIEAPKPKKSFFRKLVPF